MVSRHGFTTTALSKFTLSRWRPGAGSSLPPAAPYNWIWEGMAAPSSPSIHMGEGGKKLG